MRIPKTLEEPLKTALKDAFGEVPVYVFGSRADDTQRGGDLDLAVATTVEKAHFRTQKLRFRTHMETYTQDISIDLVQLSPLTDKTLKQEILSRGVLLE